ncbi:hypothetical protein [Microbacterium sp. SORGH_AS_0888]|uniref:hypothetical protein n=1 Tax=Microbacterium sp. SORGH_AS_0888 TaxID=3041791 RepID=UPI00278B8FB5|nr:hypothetical protein [Microbacterium sp. SORGH_AS_0888]MDQ1129770.1 hypothetical protein [Microbacterium sp. SORGH_AS_0888]
MKNRAPLAALTTAGAAVLAAAVAAPAQAATVSAAERPSHTIVLEHFPSQGACEAAEWFTSRLITATGGQVYAGDSCADRGEGRGYGFSMTYYR